MILLLTDLHFGARNDSPLFLEHYLEFFETMVFPYIKENDIKEVAHLGDLFDRRKYINFNTLTSVRKRFLEPLAATGVKVHFLIGNHDTYWRNTNEVNSVRELISHYPNFFVYEKPQLVNLGGEDIAFLPWVNKANYEESLEFIKTAKAKFLFGHLELDGYQVMSGIQHDGGMSPTLFERYEGVLSGHFHYRQRKGNIMYLGTPYEMFFSDINQRKGFHLLDMKTRSMKFIENPKKMFHTFQYDEKTAQEEIESGSIEQFRNKFVKLMVYERGNPKIFDDYVSGLVGVGAVLSVVDGVVDVKTDEDPVDMNRSTLELIQDAVDGLQGVKNPSKLKTIIKDLYAESLTL